MAKSKPEKHACSTCSGELDKDGICLECDFCKKCNGLLVDHICPKCTICVICDYCETRNFVPKDGSMDKVHCEKCSSYLRIVTLSENMNIRCDYCETVNEIKTVDFNDHTQCKKCSGYLRVDTGEPHIQREGYYGYGIEQGEFFTNDYGQKDYGYVR